MPANRDLLIKVASAVVGLFLFDRVLLTPGLDRWKAQGERIDRLREDVTRGRRLLASEKQIRAKWDGMQAGDLPVDNSEAQDTVLKGWAKWATESGTPATSFSPSWRSTDQGYSLMEVRTSTTNTQNAIGKLIYAMETDALPVRLEDIELTAKDAKGQQLTGALRFTFLRLRDGGQAR